MKQRTLKKPVKATGVGLHSGCKVDLQLLPAPVNHGIVFQRIDMPGMPCIAAKPEFVNDTRLSSTLVDGDVRVGTVEHLMSALAGFGIDNLLVTLSAQEVPLMDGSAAPFIYLMQQAGIVEQPTEKQFVRVLKPVRFEVGDKWVELLPHDGYKVSLTIEFTHPAISKSDQTVVIDFANTSFIDEVSRARTFGFMHEVEWMRSQGLALGGNLDNAVVLDEQRVLNSEGLRFDDEFVRHKVLDAIGDLYLLGHQLIGEFRGYKSGHALNNQLLRKMLEDPANYEVVSFSKPEDAPNSFHRVNTTKPTP
ncbi:UDP-3-O-acyl-N-acetylglucosamine deacetylase [Leeia sp. TBRC 13508]|uniref:UDP-3-O-acyl-N-acetylglucosamine deacetylase n=1 Tax=Leeia speluncae TaxID=2884804 RepID=A0ABS8D5Q0_9NEIS|nr:UDP-3-O-acyl-N-acetylglucosamine deacetylase [Leeia speluncae]MCB6183502.1 UDP-3-O-acyl-N-acetylglucosamine deacetylase [Leeia speluncae]